MGSVRVDQICEDGRLVQDYDVTLTIREKLEIAARELPGSSVVKFAGINAVRFEDQIILLKQVTYLGNPWPVFKKRIQIPRSWVEAEREGRRSGVYVRFVGIYQYRQLTIFVDFDPTGYVAAKANNSAAHVATNDLYQALTLGVFGRIDRNNNRLTSVRADQFAAYLRGKTPVEAPWLDAFRDFNRDFLDGQTIGAMEAVKEMYSANWPDAFQAEWPGFYLEYRFNAFITQSGYHRCVGYQKVKTSQDYDFDLVFRDAEEISHYGDLKASDIRKREAPGNDAVDVIRCINEYRRFWYVIYEHSTKKSQDYGDVETIQWNRWKQSVGHRSRKPFDELSYATRFKASVRFERMSVLEVNPANAPVVFRDFNQGRQPDGAARALKVMIKKRNIDNFLVYSSNMH